MDKKNAYYGLAQGALTCLIDAEPAPYTKRARLFKNTQGAIQLSCALMPMQGEVKEYEALFDELQAFIPLFITEESSYSELLINLIFFCLESLPTNPQVYGFMTEIIKIFPRVDKYDCIKQGEAIVSLLELKFE